MIRTAILAGIFLVLLSLAYSRPGTVPENVQKVTAMVEEQPAVKAVPLSPRKTAAHVSAPRSDDAAVAPPAPVRTVPTEAPARAEDTTRVAELPAAPAALPSPAETPAVPRAASAPPVEAPHSQIAAIEPSAPVLHKPVSLLPPPDETPSAATAAVPPAAAPPAARDMPLINVPARPVVTPWEAPPRTAASAVANAAPSDAEAKPSDDAAPKLMTPQERSRELYRLAREMEDTFIRKLAR